MTALEEKAKQVLLRNYEATGRRYICPSWPHYPNQWFWDSCFHAIACSYLGLYDLAKNEIVRLLGFQDTRGCIPSYIYADTFCLLNWRDWFAWERFMFKGWLPPAVSTVGIPVLAQAVRAIQDPQFFQKYEKQIVAFYAYFPAYRDPDRDGLISIITPREGGRDSSPEYDFFRMGRLPKIFSFLDAPLDFAFLAFMEARYKMMGWDERKILASNIFNVQDLAVQCMYIDGLYDLAWMLENWGGGDKGYPDIETAMISAEHAVLAKCWNGQDRAFYSLRNGNTQLTDITIASLFPLLIKKLPQNQKAAILELLADESKFKTPYPVPSVSVSHPAFHPSRTVPLWRGPSWINPNWFLIRGLMRHGAADIARHIVETSIEMVEKNGFREFYQPFTGEGLRVHNFGWSTLVVTFKKLLAENP